MVVTEGLEGTTAPSSVVVLGLCGLGRKRRKPSKAHIISSGVASRRVTSHHVASRHPPHQTLMGRLIGTTQIFRLTTDDTSQRMEKRNGKRSGQSGDSILRGTKQREDKKTHRGEGHRRTLNRNEQPKHQRQPFTDAVALLDDNADQSNNVSISNHGPTPPSCVSAAESPATCCPTRTATTTTTAGAASRNANAIRDTASYDAQEKQAGRCNARD